MKNRYPDSLTIQQYHDGLLDPASMHELEKQALEDPFLADALEGYGYTENSGEHLSFLQRQLHERIVHLQENKKVFDMSWQRLSVAAAAAVLFISAGILFWMNSTKTQPELAANQKQVEVSLAVPDSLSSEDSLMIEVPDPVQATISEKNLTAQNLKVVARQSTSAPVEVNLDELTVSAYGKQTIDPGIAQPSSRVAAASEAADAAEINNQKSQARKESAAKISDSRLASRAAATENGILREVVIPVSTAEPEGGWPDFNNFVIANMKRPPAFPSLKGIVLVEAELRDNGALKNLKVVQSLHPDYDKEAIRLLREGPRWKSLVKDSGKVKIAITF